MAGSFAQLDMYAILSALAEVRPIFHSEADFQHALAWKMQELSEAEIRMEVPMAGFSGRAALDIFARTASSRIGLELKFFKKSLNYIIGDESYHLLSTGARDICRYDFCKDIWRLERAIAAGFIDKGYAIALSNDPSFWKPGLKFNAIDAQFQIHDGRNLTGTLSWSDRAGSGTTAKREEPHVLAGEYCIVWRPFSQLDGVRAGEFRMLVVEVTTAALPLGVNEITSVETRGAFKHLPDSAAHSEQPLGQQRNADKAKGRERLREFFQACDSDEIALTFEQIEAIYGPLCHSAYVHQAWWYHVSSHAHAVWEHEGFRAAPKLKHRLVVFRRTPTHRSNPTSS